MCSSKMSKFTYTSSAVPKNNLRLRIKKIEPVTGGSDATVYVLCPIYVWGIHKNQTYIHKI